MKNKPSEVSEIRPFTVEEVAELFSIGRTSVYRVAAIAACRVYIPGLKAARFDRERILKLLKRKAA